MNLPAYGTRNGQKVVLGTGESLLDPTGWVGSDGLPITG
jgi:hypothetical protein